jgi:hypothetical protein
MNVLGLVQTLTAPHAPLLPAASDLVWARHILWSLVLAALGLLWVSRLERVPSLGRWLPWVLAAWAWLPGPWGVSYWLALSFQIPSLTSGFLAVAVFLHSGNQRARPSATGAKKLLNWGPLWTAAAAVLGLALLLDTFAVFAFPLHSWGFSPLALALVWAFALLPFVVSGKQGLRHASVWALCAALVVFTLTRWPTGNIWEAVLDPWLWLVASGSLVRQLWRRR